MTAPARIKRFYKSVSLERAGERYRILLDGSPARTKAKNELVAPTKKLGNAIAAEWDAQEQKLDQSTMPLTGILSTAIDGGEAAAGQWREEILDYLKSDLVCYRATEPAALVKRQADGWGPYLDFARQEFGAALVVTSGIVAVDQPSIATDAISNALSDQSPETLFALRLATAITGSAVLALALWRGDYDAQDVFEASRIDERFQEERWGEDDEAKARKDRMRAEFMSISRFLSLLHS